MSLSIRNRGVVLGGVFLLAYLAALTVLAGLPGFSPVEPLFVLLVLGGGFSLLALAVTRRSARELPAAAPTSSGEMLAVLIYLGLFALLVLGWGFSALYEALPEGQSRELAKLAIKLLFMVLLPALLLQRFGHRLKDTLSLHFNLRRHGLALLVIGLALLAFQAVFGRGLQRLDELNPAYLTLLWAIPACFLWQCLEAGLGEEVLFRVFLQQRLAGWLRSNAGAIVLGALLFGVAHAPGLYLRGGSMLEGVAEPSVAWALAYSVAVIAPAGLLFGVLWARTRSLLLVVLLHGLTDTLPHLADFIRLWG